MAETKKSDKITFSISKSTLLPLLLLFILVTPVVILARENDRIRKQELMRVYPTPTPQVTSTPTPTPTTKPVARAVQQKAEKVDTDPPVHCNISEQCGGGTRPLKQSECESRTCCQTADGWKYIEKSECESLHGKYEAEAKTKANRIPISLGGTVYYCDASAENALKDAKSTWDSEFEKANERAIVICRPKAQLVPDYGDCYAEVLKIVDYYKNQYYSLRANHCN